MTRINDNLFLASLAEANKEVGTKALGVTHILNVAQEINMDGASEGYDYMQLGVCDDDPQNDITPTLDPCIQWIHQACKGGGKVLVHCWSGVSRSAIVVMAYLVRFEHKSAVDAYHKVLARRKSVDPWPSYLQQFECWAKAQTTQSLGPND